jgi:hypothetical protein
MKSSPLLLLVALIGAGCTWERREKNLSGDKAYCCRRSILLIHAGILVEETGPFLSSARRSLIITFSCGYHAQCLRHRFCRRSLHGMTEGQSIVHFNRCGGRHGSVRGTRQIVILPPD